MRDCKKIAGRTLMVGLPGAELDGATAERLERLRPAGVILFSRNLDTPEACADLIRASRQHLFDPPLIALDQEGGRVSRLEPWVGSTPSAVELAAGGKEAAHDFARRTAAALSALGFNLDFAPVVDICAPDAGNGIGDRSFGDDAGTVLEMAGEFLAGLQGAGVAGCIKHFPGLGRTSVDSHQTLPAVRRTADQQLAEELVPFRLLAGRTASVMVGHGHYPAWDGPQPLPATGSRAIVSKLLRDDLGFGGLVVSDDLEMGAVGELDRDGAFAVKVIDAGCDLLLYCADLDRAERAVEALARAATDDEALGRRLLAAVDRVAATAARWPAPDADLSAWSAARRALERPGGASS